MDKTKEALLAGCWWLNPFYKTFSSFVLVVCDSHSYYCSDYRAWLFLRSQIIKMLVASLRYKIKEPHVKKTVARLLRSATMFWGMAMNDNRAIFVGPWNEKREQIRNNKQTEKERFEWFIERMQTPVFFGWLGERSGEKNFTPETLSRNQSMLRFDVILQ